MSNELKQCGEPKADGWLNPFHWFLILILPIDLVTVVINIAPALQGNVGSLLWVMLLPAWMTLKILYLWAVRVEWMNDA